MMFTNHPCVKDCPDRTATCKKTCERLKKYTELKAKERKEKDKQFVVDCYQIDVLNKHKRRKR